MLLLRLMNELKLF